MSGSVGVGLTCSEVEDLAAPYVLGALEPDEMDAVRGHLASCADAHPEFAELGSVVPLLVASAPVMIPPPGLRDRLMAAAAADLQVRRSMGTQDATAPTRATAPPPVMAMPRRRTTSFGGAWAMRIAAVLAIAVLGGWNLVLQGQLASARTYEQHVATVLDVAGQPGSLTAILTAEGGGGPTGLAAVSADGSVTIAMRDLAPTSGQQVYEAWVIGSDGVPSPLGGFQVGSSGIATFSGSGLPTDPGIVLALTLEPAPGAASPTLPVVSLGTATAAG